MKNTLNLSFVRPSNHEFGGFHNRVSVSCTGVTTEGIQELLDTYNESIEKFTSVISDFSFSDARHSVSLLDKERTRIFGNFRNQVKLLRKSPDETIGQFSEEIWKLIKPFNCIRGVNQSSTTDIIKTVVTTVKELVGEPRFKNVLKSSGLEIWFTQLENSNKGFIDADQNRSDERLNRKLDSIQSARENCVKIYNKLINFVEYNANINNDESCIEFISKVEGFVEDCRRLNRLRTNRSKNNSTKPSSDGNNNGGTCAV